jgi:hypothetical protein
VISGLLLGFLYRAAPRSIPALRVKLIDRGLFMLTLGHVLIGLAHVPVAGGLTAAYQWGFITDVIALGLLVGPVPVERIPPAQRLVLAGLMYTLAWTAVVVWQPDTAILERVKEYVFGPANFITGRPRLVFECFPLVPWLTVYVGATALGERLGRLQGAGRGAEANATLTRLALACFVLALAVKAVPFALKELGVLPTSEVVWTMGWPFQKQPPSLAYLGLFGLGLLLLRLWPGLLIISLGAVLAFGLLWSRWGSNDIFSVGYQRLAAPASRAHSARASAP